MGLMTLNHRGGRSFLSGRTPLRRKDFAPRDSNHRSLFDLDAS
jgi:hypothetical protein